MGEIGDGLVDLGWSVCGVVTGVTDCGDGVSDILMNFSIAQSYESGSIFSRRFVCSMRECVYRTKCDRKAIYAVAYKRFDCFFFLSGF